MSLEVRYDACRSRSRVRRFQRRRALGGWRLLGESGPWRFARHDLLARRSGAPELGSLQGTRARAPARRHERTYTPTGVPILPSEPRREARGATRLGRGLRRGRDGTTAPRREGVDRESALRKLREEEAKIALGQWVDMRATAPIDAQITFEVYVSDWFSAKSCEVSENRREELRWQLTKHLIPFFGPYALCEIDRRLVKEFRKFKLAQRDRLAERIAAGERPVDERRQPLRPLSNTSINKLLQTTS